MINIVELTYTETERQSVGKAICDVLDGSIDVAWIRGVGDGVICDEIASRFHNSLNALSRKDEVPGTMVGESHYFKKPDDYYARCKESMVAVDALFEVGKNPIKRLYSLVQEYRGGVLRAARYNGRDALHTRAIAWKEMPGSEFLLRPHDDVSQVFCERNEGWEICNIKTLLAINFYAQCEAGEGMLKVFDLKHTPELAERAGVVRCAKSKGS